MNVHEVMSLPPGPRYRLLADRFHAHRLWAHEDVFAEAFAAAAALAYADTPGRRSPEAERFVEYTYINLITRPGDLVGLCRRLHTEDLCLAVVEAYVHHPLAPPDVLAAMGASGEVYRDLPPGGWAEVPIHLYAASRLNAEPTRRFDLHELFPYGTVHDEPAARSALRSALEAGQLADRAGTAAQAADEMPAPDFIDGQRVEVVLNDRNHTAHRGTVRAKVWHYRDRRWLYLLRHDAGRKISKRYAAEDLRAVSQAPGLLHPRQDAGSSAATSPAA